jgi:hypothetical protein
VRRLDILVERGRILEYLRGGQGTVKYLAFCLSSQAVLVLLSLNLLLPSSLFDSHPYHASDLRHLRFGSAIVGGLCRTSAGGEFQLLSSQLPLC